MKKIIFKSVFFFTLSLFVLVSVFQASAKKARESDVAVFSDDQDMSAAAVQKRNLATVTNQVNAMVSQFQQMNGDIGRAEKRNNDQDKIIRDSQLRLQTLEDRMGILTTQLSELKAAGFLKPQAGANLEQFKEFSKAVENINSKNYAKAITDLKAFQTTNKKSSYLEHAQYWIGEAYYQQSDYEMAIAELQKVISKNAKSPKAPSALYKQGLSFFHLQSFEDAQAFFAKVVKTYPQSVEASLAQSQIVRIDRILELRKKVDAESETVESVL